MTPEVLRLLSRLRTSISAQGRIVLLSPSREERAMFPRARVLTVKDWDLNHPKPDLRADVILASHVFHYSRDPALWLRNVLASCRAFLFVDLVSRQRSPDAEWGRDRDCMRYAIGPHRPQVTPHFDLNSLGERLLAYQAFDGGRNEFGEALHFLAVVRGDLTQPLLRIDWDGPDALRVAGDHRAQEAVLGQFEERGLAYYLGVAPAAGDDPVVRGLRDLPHMAAAQLGNGGSVWRRYGTVCREVGDGKRSLEHALEREIDVYIARDGRCGRTMARALRQHGFRLCLAEMPARGRLMPTLRSDFSGPSDEFPAGSEQPETITLSTAAEARLWIAGQRASLPALLDAVRDGVGRRRVRLDRLAHDVASARPA